MRKLWVLILAIFAFGLTACDYTIQEGDPVPPTCCHSNLNDQLNVIVFEPTQELAQARCDDMGADHLLFYGGYWVCMDVDY